jgi:uncharacterized SAM-binding protein YcdF (DUF218 family)
VGGPVPSGGVALIVLGAAVWPEGPSPTLARRTAHAVRLWHRGGFAIVVPCGGLGRHPPSEAEAMTRLLIAGGVPRERIVPEDQSTTTEENIRLALPILQHRDIGSVLIVTDWYHAPRARMVARRLGLNARSSSPGLQGTRPLAQAKYALREVAAFLWYWLNPPQR